MEGAGAGGVGDIIVERDAQKTDGAVAKSAVIRRI